MSNMPQVTITSARLGFALAIVSAITLGWNTVSYFKSMELKDFSQDQEISALKDVTKGFEVSLKELSSETRELRVAVVKLTTVMEGRSERAALSVLGSR